MNRDDIPVLKNSTGMLFLQDSTSDPSPLYNLPVLASKSKVKTIREGGTCVPQQNTFIEARSFDVL